ncbi:MAG: tetratricopeptide repeat protein, partial [Pseudomonadota bacterium]
IDESGLNDIMLNFADPNAAANYFRNALNNDPTRVEFKRGYARSLMRARRSAEAVLAYEQMNDAGEMNNDDRMSYAEALLQNGDWDKAEAQLNAIPPTVETYDRYRLEAMVADYRKNWKKADSFYETARGLTTRPAPILNNWGISKMQRKDFKSAEKKFLQAITFDPKLFSAKNNLVISRANRRVYDLPGIPLSGTERAELLHNIALQAVRNGDIATGRGLLEEAIDAHPQHFPEAQRKLAALDTNVAR